MGSCETGKRRLKCGQGLKVDQKDQMNITDRKRKVGHRLSGGVCRTKLLAPP